MSLLNPGLSCLQEAQVKEKRAKQKENQPDQEAEEQLENEKKSPFLQISATMGWDTFSIVQKLWLSTIDLPTNSPEKDWPMQVRLPLVADLCQSACQCGESRMFLE